MKILWCWRCQMEVPMFDEIEYPIARDFYLNAIRDVKFQGEKELRFEPLIEYHKSVTGILEVDAEKIIHHAIELYGPPCEKCGKPYRTPKASFCAACGNKRNSI